MNYYFFLKNQKYKQVILKIRNKILKIISSNYQENNYLDYQKSSFILRLQNKGKINFRTKKYKQQDSRSKAKPISNYT